MFDITVGPCLSKPLGPGYDQNSGFSTSLSQASYMYMYLYYFYNEIQANILPSAYKPDHHLTIRLCIQCYTVFQKIFLS